MIRLSFLGAIAMASLGLYIVAMGTTRRSTWACPEPVSQVILTSHDGPVCVNATPAIRVPR